MLYEMCRTRTAASFHAHPEVYTISSKSGNDKIPNPRQEVPCGTIGHMMQNSGVGASSLYLPNYIV